MCLSLVVLAVDMVTPFGVASGVLCLVIVAASLWHSARRRDVLLAAAVCTAALLPGFFLLPAGGEFWSHVFTRLLSLVAIWCLVGFGVYIGQPTQRISIWPVIGRIAYVGLTICFFLLAAIWGISIWADAQGRKHISSIRHQEHARSAIARVLSTMQDAEIGERGYLLTADEQYLKPYQAALATVGDDLHRLRSLTSNSPLQQQALNELEPLIDAKLKLLAEKISVRRTEGLASALRHFEDDPGIRLMDAIRRLVRKMDDQEKVLVELHADHAERSAQIAAATRFLGIATTFVTALLVVVHLSRNLHAHEQLSQSLAESEHRLTLATEGTSDGLWDWNLLTNDVWYAPLFKQLLGYADHDDEFPDRFESFESHVHPDDHQPTMAAVRQHLEENLPYDVEYRLRHKSGEYRWFRARGKASRNAAGEPLRMSGSIQDVTDRKRAEETLARRADELRRSNEELEQFAYVASHDLKEPLRMVASYTRLLAEEYEDLLDDEGKKYIGYATDGAKRMQALIDDLLAYSRVGRVEAPPQPVDLNDVMGVVRDNLASLLEESAGLLEVGELPTIAGNPTVLVQLLQNLVANAIKFRGDKPPLIWVSCQHRDDELVIAVEDNGIGIAPQYHQRIFQVFQRLHSRSEYEGTGIGLAVCKKIVEQSGGRIWIESEPGQGTTFYFTLPQEHSHPPAKELELALT
jgi:PAS domain S-box-containing protein